MKTILQLGTTMALAMGTMSMPAFADSTSKQTELQSTGAVDAGKLVGKDVIDDNGDTVGEVLIDDGGSLVDVGGFLGMGTHHVLLNWKDINLTGKGDDVKAVVNTTKEILKSLPEYLNKAEN